MNAADLHALRRTLLRAARAVAREYQRVPDLTTIPLPRVPKQQSFARRHDEEAWFSLLGFERLIRAAKNRNVEAYVEMLREVRVVEEELVSCGEPTELPS